MPRADNFESQANNREVPLSDLLTDHKGSKPFSDGRFLPLGFFLHEPFIGWYSRLYRVKIQRKKTVGLGAVMLFQEFHSEGFRSLGAEPPFSTSIYSPRVLEPAPPWQAHCDEFYDSRFHTLTSVFQFGILSVCFPA